MPARLADKAKWATWSRQAVATLSDNQRMAVLLSKFESMSHDEIGEAMQMSPQAVKIRLPQPRSKRICEHSWNRIWSKEEDSAFAVRTRGGKLPNSLSDRIPSPEHVFPQLR